MWWNKELWECGRLGQQFEPQYWWWCWCYASVFFTLMMTFFFYRHQQDTALRCLDLPCVINHTHLTPLSRKLANAANDKIGSRIENLTRTATLKLKWYSLMMTTMLKCDHIYIYIFFFLKLNMNNLRVLRMERTVLAVFTDFNLQIGKRQQKANKIFFRVATSASQTIAQ